LPAITCSTLSATRCITAVDARNWLSDGILKGIDAPGAVLENA
jgi:hypothetical protein